MALHFQTNLQEEDSITCEEVVAMKNSIVGQKMGLDFQSLKRQEEDSILFLEVEVLKSD